jgi:Response regulator containing CheY-like receiver, AAA-type ATPase, and DNA-binding domains
LKLEKWEQKLRMPADLMDTMAQKLPYKVLLMLKNVLASKDPDSMISEILTTALEFTDMDRAVLILHEEPRRIFKSVAIEESAVKEICEISKSATESVSESGKPFICLNASADPYIKSKPSIISNHIMSIVCLPLKTQDKTIGMIYLDSKEGVESLTKTERLLLEVFASIISLALNRAIDFEKSIEENKFLRETTEWRKIFPEIIGKSKAVIDIFKTLNRLLDNDLPVLIYGETGTGKELIARVLHFCGKRKSSTFIAVNCSAFSRELMESELFGHERGAFTGAANLKRGLFEEAQNGTLFLDEISELPFSMQAKLLRVLQGGEFRRVGGTQTLRSNARIVLATNRDLAQMVKDKEFREDLYYRIKGVQVHVPSLRERTEDIPLLANEFLKETILATRKPIQGFTPDALSVLKHYEWPGNVRQLKLEIEKIVALSENEWISVEDLDPQIREGVQKKRTEVGNGSGSLQEMERAIILERLQKYEGNIIQAAKSLGISRHGLYSKMRRYQIPAQSK